MVEIQLLSDSVKVTSLALGRVPEDASKVITNDNEKESKTSDRTIHDRVDLSGTGGEMINLARGQELSREIRSKSVDEDFAATLRKAMEDIFRITRLFAETIKAAFKRWI